LAALRSAGSGERGAVGRHRRLGGDELALWAPIDPSDSGRLAEAVRTDVAAGLGQRGIAVDLLLGSAPAAPGADAHAVLQAAIAAVRQPGPGHTQRAA
jgi:hypothetical protein